MLSGWEESSGPPKSAAGQGGGRAQRYSHLSLPAPLPPQGAAEMNTYCAKSEISIMYTLYLSRLRCTTRCWRILFNEMINIAIIILPHFYNDITQVNFISVCCRVIEKLRRWNDHSKEEKKSISGVWSIFIIDQCQPFSFRDIFEIQLKYETKTVPAQYKSLYDTRTNASKNMQY